MTGIDEAAAPPGERLGAVLRATVVAVGAGIAAGVASMLLELWTPGELYPWWFLPFFHTLAPWLMLTMVVGWSRRTQLAVAAWAGLVTQLTLTTSYDLSYAMYEGFGPGTEGLRLPYLFVALVSGPVYGAAGASLRDARRTVRVACCVLAGAPWFYGSAGRLKAASEATIDGPWLTKAGLFAALIGVCVMGLVARSVIECLVSLPLAMAAGTAMLVLLPLVGDAQAGSPFPDVTMRVTGVHGESTAGPGCC